MRWADRLEVWSRGWRGPALAALVALVAGLPGLIALPPLDRDESRFAEATVQMLESGDFVTIHFQDQPRFKKPVGIYWLQAASVAALSHAEDRAIWAYRVPSLLGAMLAAAACAWGASGFLGARASILAGAMLGASFLLSTEADIAATDGVLCGAVTLSMAALARLYCAALEGRPATVATKVLFWVGMALSVIVKGPIGPMVAGLTLVALWLWDRRAGWMRTLGWGWGLILLAAVVGPWAMAITVATDGAFWGAAVGGDLAPKLVKGDLGHGQPPGFYLLTLPLLIFPFCLFLPGGAMLAWRQRADGWVRFALCWLIPSWIVFELVPTKLVHYPLPLYGALAWLMAGGLHERAPRAARLAGVVLMLFAAAVLLAGALALATRVTTPLGAIVAFAGLAVASLGGALYLARDRLLVACAVAGTGGVIAHAAFVGWVAPNLHGLWLSSRAAAALTAAAVNPRNGVTPGPVTVSGYAEPSLIFLLGQDTVLGAGADAAEAVVDGRPAIVEAREEPAFRAALGDRAGEAAPAATVAGLDYSNGRADVLRLYRPLTPAATVP
jgi:4-amino-4-deoxy-L-arabinose transferase-like glycosyltransferase